MRKINHMTYELEKIGSDYYINFKHEDGGEDFISFKTLKNVYYSYSYYQGMYDWVVKTHPEIFL